VTRQTLTDSLCQLSASSTNHCLVLSSSRSPLSELQPSCKSPLLSSSALLSSSSQGACLVDVDSYTAFVLSFSFRVFPDRLNPVQALNDERQPATSAESSVLSTTPTTLHFRMFHHSQALKLSKASKNQLPKLKILLQLVDLQFDAY